MNNSIKNTALAYYTKFCSADGNQHIAGVYGLEVILKLVHKNKPKNILEVGLGIGAIVYSILKYSNEKNLKNTYFGTESNDFCLEQLPLNLGENYSKLNLYKSLNEVPKDIKFDFIIIDGSDDQTNTVKNIISENGVIFIEGYRMSQVKTIQNVFPKSLHVSLISSYKNPDFGPFDKNIWSGGGQLIYVNPTLSQKIDFLAKRISTSFKYKVLRKLSA